MLLALPLVLPFEVPLFPLGPLVLTSAELVLYPLLALWAAGRVSGGRRPRWPADWLGRAALIWLGVVVLSALLAPSHRGEALKAALRALAGGLLFFAAGDLLRSPVRARRLALVVVAGALLSAAAALVEVLVPSTAPLWRLFHPTGFQALGLPRASGSFAYPTIGAMYWEAVLPLAAALVRGQPRKLGAIAAAAAALLVAAILASATRAALVGATLASVAMLVLGWRAGGAVRIAAAGAVGSVALLLGLTWLPAGSESPLQQRLRFWNDGAWYRAHYAVSGEPLTLAAGDEAAIPVTVTNAGSLTWPHQGPQPVHLSYHWETTTAAGEPRLEFEGRRTPLPGDVPPGGTVSLEGLVIAPLSPGRYRLRWDLVRERVTWFSERGSTTADQVVQVVPGAPPTAPRRPRRVMASSLEAWVATSLPSRRELWRAAIRLWQRHPLTGVGPDNFRRRYPEVIAPAQPGRRFTDHRQHANNLYLETLAGLGLLGLCALGLTLFGLGGALRARLAERDLLGVAAAVGAATYFVHGLLDYFLAFTPTYGLYWLLLALARRPAADGQPAPPDSSRAAL